MLDLGTLLINVKTQGVNDVKKQLNSIKSDAGKSADGIQGKFGALGGKIGSMLKAGAVAGIAALGVATIKIGKDAIKAYADYEQLAGGVQKIFGEDTAKIVEKNAKAAFSTAGISANQYMEQVTSFSASLLQSVGGDTKKAANIADMAIRDMSDNANTFGTDITMIQNAYQGFAKQNYTMLDNLKLGYGGTKTEMERLLADAEKITGKKYDLSNLKDVYEAIHVIQEETNVTGTTAKEAAKTISGSIASMKASWTNLMTAIATGDSKEIDKAMSDFGKSAINVIKNLIPAIGRVAVGMSKALINGFTSINWGELGGNITSKISDIAKALINAFKSINWGELLNNILTKISGIFNSIGAKLPTLIPQLSAKLLAGIQSLISKFTSFITNFSNGEGTNSMMSAAGNLVKGLVTGLIKAYPIFVQATFKIWGAIGKLLLTILVKSKEMGLKLIMALGNGLVSGIAAAFAPFINKTKQSFNKLKSNITTIFNNIKKTIKNIVTSIKTTVSNVFNSIKTTVSNIVKGIRDTAVNVFTSMKNGIKNGISGVIGIVKNIFNNAKNAILNPLKTARDKVKEIINKIKDFFKFKVSAPKIPLPHFKISPSGWKMKDLLDGTVPELDVKWYKKGGFFNGPTVLSGVGEAGPEYVLPLNSRTLTPLAKLMNQLIMKDLINRPLEEQPIIVNTVLEVDGKTIAKTTAPYMRDSIDKLNVLDNRQLGLV